MFKDDPPLMSFNRFNHRLRNIISTEEDWDKEFALLSQFNGLLNSSKSIDDGHDEEMEDDDEMNQALICSQPLSSRQLNF